MEPPLWLMQQQTSPLTWLAASVFLIPAAYVILSAVKDRAWVQFGAGTAFAGIVVLFAFNRLLGAAVTIGGLAIAFGAVAIPHWRGENEEFQLD